MDRSPSSKSAQPSNVSDRAWKIAQLAAVLVQTFNQKERGPRGLKVNPRLASKELDSYYAAALKRADILLSWAEGRGGDVHAYQLFEEGERLTEAQIMKIFKGVGWDGVKSKQPVMDLMDSLRGDFEEHLETFRRDSSQTGEEV